MVDGAVAGYGWLSTEPEWIGEVQLEIRPRKGEGYIWNCVTLAAHRRKGDFRSLVASIAEAARDLGLNRVWIGSVAVPAEKALAPLGFSPAARFSTIRFAGQHLMRVSYADSPLGRDGRRVLSAGRGLYWLAVSHRRH